IGPIRLTGPMRPMKPPRPPSSLILHPSAFRPVLRSSPMILGAVDVSSYLPVLLLIGMAVGFAVVNIVLTRVIGPARAGKVKGVTYESGMDPVGTARKRFNVRFYLIAMVFLVFDIEIIFLYPWAATFPNIVP